ncbi:N-formylglutamate amidohydrolase [Rufibacter sp. DG15C]|uniref:N-formylglutamate amidohydrolase n=1 Tax=Rufibacter sp. DG15C TaxID=1379909 RepID=UPI00078DF365|nr:N-formylglutamate amidohydrolase [Rufibacter sp. DG15C]AMM52213.1 N-formylglutamate amidohydrolase [Rufibacter sp. DG15C]
MSLSRRKVIFTCEHGGNELPSEFNAAFDGAEEALTSHRGYDIGALELFQKFAESKVADVSFSSTTSRLLIELNRSRHHPKLFSEFTQPLSEEEKRKIVTQHYAPYRDKVEGQINEWIQDGFYVFHLSVHSFTPVLDGDKRKADIGLLYNPSREVEQLFASKWRQEINKLNSDYKVRYNYPYKGTSDGFVTLLRRKHGADQYAGLELEVNQKFALGNQEEWSQLQEVLVQSFEQAL